MVEWPPSGTTLWTLTLRVGQMDGPNCGKLLRKLDSLQNYVPEKFHCYIDCLRKYDLVKKACFGTDFDEEGWRQKIEDFKVSYLALKINGKPISVTVKAHCVFYEIPIWIGRHNR